MIKLTPSQHTRIANARVQMRSNRGFPVRPLDTEMYAVSDATHYANMQSFELDVSRQIYFCGILEIPYKEEYFK